MAKQQAFYFDASACIGCKSCEIACKDKNNLPVGVRLRRVVEQGGGHWEMIDGFAQPVGIYTYFVSSACMHCEDPACVNVCPTGAMYKRDEDGLVLINHDKCIGCNNCALACPYGAPQYNPSAGQMAKCDFCASLNGETPACVATCPQRALNFGDLDELREQYGDECELAPLPSGDLTHPSFVMTPHRYSKKTGTDTDFNRHHLEV